MEKEEKKQMREIIDENRLAGGSSWRDYTKKEIEEIYSYLPHWADNLG